eukprot:TRINITY_DN10370_c0_g1_i4.p1 TRINITY_DN10370_c0_g1~~TRINITY_DN10370_c0_g1_i4.p1  ORF type:complete len:344 (-),score=39.98 TRINITY_DN10370_c0_g1_i4:150-1181(-)
MILDFEAPLEDQTVVNQIRDAIRNEDKRLRSKHHWLAHQDAIGVAVLAMVMLSVTLVTTAWHFSLLSGMTAIVLNAVILSLVHEVEHDLIHDLYFPNHPVVQNLMFGFIWVLKMHVLPWWRKKYHLIHHQESGLIGDVEERIVGLGTVWWNPIRWISVLTPLFGLVAAIPIARDVKDFKVFSPLNMANFPSIFIGHSCMFAQAMIYFGWWPQHHNIVLPYYTAICVFNMSLNFPNVLRQGCLTFVTTYCHYYGDIPADVFYQTQVLDHPVFWPFQVFCFNFGATHLLHHFVTKQPFYLRQMVAWRVLPIVKKTGVRVNDLGNQWRSNHWATRDSSSTTGPLSV